MYIMPNTKKTYATVNFSDMYSEPFNLLSSLQLALNERAELHKKYKNMQAAGLEKAIKEGYVGDERKKKVANFCATEKAQWQASKERCNGMANVFIIRYVSTEDALHGNVFKFDVKTFLTNIGVYKDGEDDKKALKRVTAIRDSVVGRTENKSSKFKDGYVDENGNAVLVPASSKELKDSMLEVAMAIIAACIDSKAIEYSKGGLAFVKH